MELKIKKTRMVKTPTRGTEFSAGLDFYIPFSWNGKPYLNPNEDTLIPSGIYAKIPPGHTLIAFNKSGVALNGLSVGACVIDEDYQGEIHLHVFNRTKRRVSLAPGDKLVQFLLIPVRYPSIRLVDIHEDLFCGKTTKRGSGGFGSTGK